MPGISNQVADALDRGWHYATLLFGETQIRTGHLLVAMLKSLELRRALDRRLAGVRQDPGRRGRPSAIARSGRDRTKATCARWTARASPRRARKARPPRRARRARPRSTASARTSPPRRSPATMDPILGRDEEIRQIVDVLMRRRQNNPILTGEAGVGKTAVVEGFAQRIASGDVPPPLRGVKLCVLDVGLMQAGASMKGEFEQRLRSVIDEVQSSPTPIILFIDEAHTLIGAGGAAGTGDAANLLKPALARGTLRTIAATTWSEYRQYFEKDPALTRRFQPIHIGEPDVATAAVMLRGLVGPMEKHHKVRVTDEAIVAAVNFSNRYIPARQLPDKAVSLLDTACARVAISQNAKPAAVEDAEVAIAAPREREGVARARARPRRRQRGAHRRDRRQDRREAREARSARRPTGTRSASWSKKSCACARRSTRPPRPSRRPPSRHGGATRRSRAPTPAPRKRRRRSEAAADSEALRAKVGELGKIEPEKRMIYAACRRAGGRLRRLGLDRHSGRQDGRRRDRDRAPSRRHSQPAHRRPEPRPAR